MISVVWNSVVIQGDLQAPHQSWYLYTGGEERIPAPNYTFPKLFALHQMSLKLFKGIPPHVSLFSACTSYHKKQNDPFQEKTIKPQCISATFFETFLAFNGTWPLRHACWAPVGSGTQRKPLFEEGVWPLSLLSVLFLGIRKSACKANRMFSGTCKAGHHLKHLELIEHLWKSSSLRL